MVKNIVAFHCFHHLKEHNEHVQRQTLHKHSGCHSNGGKVRMQSHHSTCWFSICRCQSWCANSKMQFFTILPETLLKHNAREDHSIVVGVAWAKYCDVLEYVMVSYCGVQSEAEPSERSTWGRPWPRRSPQAESLARVRASHNKCSLPQRNVLCFLGWCHSPYRCSTQGDGTCPSAWPPFPWSRKIKRNNHTEHYLINKKFCRFSRH